MRRYRRIIKAAAVISLAVLLFFIAVNVYVVSYSARYILDGRELDVDTDAIIIPGAYVFPDGQVSMMLRDRLDTALAGYMKVSGRMLVSGDHGNKDYDEVRAMKDHLLSEGVSEHDIFMDHAGFSTYDTMYRAKAVFLVESALICTQKYHLYRAIFVARKYGIEAYGAAADLHTYPGMTYYRLREALARVKDFFLVIFRTKPVFLGEKIDIRGSGLQTED